MRIHIAADHAAFEAKNALADFLRSKGHDVVDHGAHVYDAEDDYPAFCFSAAEAVVAEPGSLGVVMGGSGNGEQIAANKVKGARAALAWSVQTAVLAREHNDANVISVGARMHSVDEVNEIVDAFINTAYSNAERHSRRIKQLAEYEA